MNILTKEQPIGGSAKAFGPFAKPRYSLKFDAAYNQFGRVYTDVADQYFGTDDFSFSYWWKLPAPAPNQFFRWQDDSVQSAIHSTLGYIRHRIIDDVATTVITGQVNVCDNNWHHVAITCDRDGYAKCYIDDVLITTTTCLSTGDLNTGGVSSLFFGTDASFPPSYYSAQIDQLTIWDSAISAVNVSALYNSGTPVTDWTLLPIPQALWEFDEGSGVVANGEGSEGIDMTLFGINIGSEPTWEDPA